MQKKASEFGYLLRALLGNPDRELREAQYKADVGTYDSQRKYNQWRRSTGRIPVDYEDVRAIRAGYRVGTLRNRPVNYNDPADVWRAHKNLMDYARIVGAEAYPNEKAYQNKEVAPRDKATMGAPIEPKLPKSRNLPEKPQKKIAGAHNMDIDTVRNAMQKRAAGVQGLLTPAFMRYGQNSQYATYNPGHFSTQDQSRVSTMAGRMGIRGPISSIRMQNGQITGLNGIGHSQQPIAVQYSGRPSYGMQGILSAKTPVQQLIGAIRTTRGIGPDFNPMTPRGLAPIPKPNTEGLSDYSRAMLLANWRAQNEPIRQRRLQYWSGQHDNLAAAEARRRLQIIANNNALRGKPMRGFYKDNATGNFVAINGTAGGQNFSKREDMALQGYALPKRNLMNVTTTDWSKVKPAHYKMTPNLQRPNDPKTLRKQLRATA